MNCSRGYHTMFYADDEFGVRLHISKAARGKKYVGPVCQEPVIVKRGGHVAQHFAHKANKYCDPWQVGKMSPWHLKMQSLFPEETHEVVVQSEEQSEYHIADVILENSRYIFEFQHSPISVDDFVTRSIFYINLGYSLVWIFDYTDLDRPKYLYYEDVDFDRKYKRFVWPGKDRIKLFDSDGVHALMEVCQDYGINFTVLFHVFTGKGRTICVDYANGYSSTQWRYVDPLAKREEGFIRPDFDKNYRMEDFYARFFTKDEFMQHIKKLVK